MDALLQALYAKTSNVQLLDWITDKIELCQPDAVHWCDGSSEEYDLICTRLMQSGTAIQLDCEKRPNSYLCRTDPRDAGTAAERTFICSRKQEDAGPTNNWCSPLEMKATLKPLFRGCMRGRTLYIVPFALGPLGAPLSQIGIQLTDSPYVVAHMRIATRMGTSVLQALGDGVFVPCLHSVGRPLASDETDVPWPCNPENTYIAHFPESREVWSFGSGYGDNALLSQKCVGLRMASVMAREQGWLAEHMSVLGVTNPAGKKIYIAAAFANGSDQTNQKTNLVMMAPALPGWKVECVSNEIAWLYLGRDDRLHAMNPEMGLCGAAAGTNWDTNPNAMVAMTANTIFTNVALTDDGDVWWEGLTEQPPAHLMDWTGQNWTPACGRKATGADAGFMVPAAQCAVVDARREDGRGVPISAILFCGARSTLTPLIYEAYSWAHGVFLGATLASENMSQTRRDPFAMLPFCGYNLADYFSNWLRIGRMTHPEFLPRVFAVNWLRKDAAGSLLWPGYGENIRVLKWIFERVHGAANDVATPIGGIPAPGSIDTNGQQLSPDAMKQLLLVNSAGWAREVASIAAYFKVFGTRMPPALTAQLKVLQERIAIAQMVPDESESGIAELNDAAARRP